MLTSGLMVKEAPKLFKPNQPPPKVMPTVNTGGYPLPPPTAAAGGGGRNVDFDSRLQTYDSDVVESNITTTMSSRYNVSCFFALT